MRARRYWSVAVTTLISLSFCSCVMVPPRDGAAAIDVNAVVTRVKCDLRNIVLEKARKKIGGAQPFLFLRSWAAKICLTSWSMTVLRLIRAHR